jgi:hypothetical protein
MSLTVVTAKPPASKGLLKLVWPQSTPPPSLYVLLTQWRAVSTMFGAISEPVQTLPYSKL